MKRITEKYLTLIREFPLRPITNDKELDRATGVINSLVDRGRDDLTADEQAYLDVLADLVEKYENEHHAIESMPPHEMLAESMKAKDITQTELSKATGIPISTISELISQKRDFNRSHIEKLCAYFGFGPGAFIHVGKPELVGK